MAQVHSQQFIDVVAQLLQRPFGSRNIADRRLTVQQPRPMPVLKLKTGNRTFQKDWYTKKDWLCGSVLRNSLFCWPCLLFRPGVSQSWTERGYGNLRNNLPDGGKHEKSKSQMEAYKMWKTFDVSEGIDLMLSRARRDEIERHNDEVRQNRGMLRTLSEAVLYLSKQELLFRGHDESSSSLNRGNYRELLECFSKFDTIFERRLHGKIAESERGNIGVFTGVSSDTQNDLIECIDSVIQDHIDEEVQKCNFLSVQVGETTDVSTKEQLSVIIRLDKNDDVERFLKFYNVSSDRTAPAISAIIKDILSNYGDSIHHKLIMQTYGGASVMSGHISGVQTLVREDYPFAYFFHCAAHRLNLVLCQSASSIPLVRVFFANVAAFSSFSSSSPRRKDLLHSNGIDIPKPGETRWYYRSCTISVLHDKYKALLDLLDRIIEHPQGWDDASISQASGLYHFMNSFLFCFLIHVFNRILEQSSLLYMVLQNRNTDFSYGVQKIATFANFLCDLRTDRAYDDFFQSTVSLIGRPSSNADRRHNYRSLYFQVIDNIKCMLSERFADCDSFAFLDLVYPYIFKQWRKGVPSDMLQSLKSKYGPLFNIQSLESQLLFIYNDPDFHKDSPLEILHYIYKCGLETSAPEAVRLLKLNSVISISSASVERSFSCLKRVKTYLRNRMGQDRLGSLCRISLHKDVLKEVENKNVLHDSIVQKFVEKPRRLNFLFK